MAMAAFHSLKAKFDPVLIGLYVVRMHGFRLLGRGNGGSDHCPVACDMGKCSRPSVSPPFITVLGCSWACISY